MPSLRLTALLCVAVFGSTTTNTALALTCYVCSTSNSTVPTECDDPFSAGSLTTVSCNGGACYKTKIKTTVTFLVSLTTTTYDRGCWPTSMTAGCTTNALDLVVGSVSETDCYCSSDKCNGATATLTARGTAAVAIMTAATAAMLRFAVAS